MKELADELRDAYAAAGIGNKVVTVHIFGIEYAARLKGVNLKELAARAGIIENYGPELSKGMKLADYVKIVSKP